MIYIIILVVILGLIFAFFKPRFLSFKNNKIRQLKGSIGENKVKQIIGCTEKGKQYVLNDYMIDAEGKSSQIDHILINAKGIFVIETKNYSGTIYGTENQQEWTQVFNYGKRKEHFYNPVKQNNTHLYYLHQLLPNYKFKSVVVFVQNNIKNIDSDKVIGLNSLKSYLKNGNDELSVEQMEEIYSILNKQKEECNVTNKQHIVDIHKELENIDNNICPRCGAPLVKRKGKHGEFYGCSNYPKCKFIKK